MAGPARPMGGGEVSVDDLVAVLGRERQVLEALLFRLLEARGLLATGEARFLSWAANDIEHTAESVREVELRRATCVEQLGGGDGHARLRDLARGAPEPFASLLDDHREALGRLAVEVGAAIEATEELATEGLRRIRAVELASCGAHLGPRGLRGHGSASSLDALEARRQRHLAEMDDLDRELTAAGYEAVLQASQRLALPSLVAFLS